MAKKIARVEGRIEVVDLATLKIDEAAYQRGEKHARRRIRDEFDAAAAGVLHVGERADGERYLIDGQQRRWAMLELGITKWKAYVIHSTGPQYEAGVFDQINGKNRTALTSKELLKAKLWAGDPTAVALRRAVEAAGLKLKLWSGGGRTWNELECVGQLYNLCGRHGEATLTRALSVMTKTWDRQDALLKRDTIPVAMCYLYHAQGDLIDDERFVSQCQDLPPMKIINESASGLRSRHAVAQEILARQYNRKLQNRKMRLKLYDDAGRDAEKDEVAAKAEAATA